MTETRQEIETRIRRQTRSNFTKLSPPDATYQFVVTSTQKLDQPSKGDKDGNGAGCPTLAVRAAPLAIENDPSSVQAQYETTIWVTLPVVNPDIEGHTVDLKTSNNFKSQMAALVPERVPYVPAKLPDGEWDNTPGTKERQLQARIEGEVLATEINEGDFKLDDRTFYATTKKAPEGKEGYYTNNLHAELRPGEKLGTLGAD